MSAPLSSESRAFLSYLAAQPKGRVGYDISAWDMVDKIASEAIEAAYVKRRRRGFNAGFQITPEGREYLGGLD